eukprot:12414976-Karenia_brevis.AAC.1
MRFFNQEQTSTLQDKKCDQAEFAHAGGYFISYFGRDSKGEMHMSSISNSVPCNWSGGWQSPVGGA